ncbi:MAG: alpha/beta hydrolase [Gemmatimonadales bacterium]|nr:alpha/beta hydrolase [Gemmatimonadales bacterium]
MPRRTRFFTLALRGIALLIVAYAVVIFLAWRFQDRVAFPGRGGRLPFPSEFGITDGQVVSVETSDHVTLRGWYLPPSPAPPAGERAPGLIWFHGNVETVRSIADVLRDFRPPGIAVLALDYRGYSESGGTPTEVGVHRDAEAAWAFLAERPEIDSLRIAVYGRSIGSAVGLYLANERPVRAVVLDSPFTSAQDMARAHYAPVPSDLVELSLDNLTRAARLTVPLLVFHGTDDIVAPFAMGEAVSRAGRAEELVVLQGAGHTTMYETGGTLYRDKLHDFLRRHLGAIN